MSHKYKMKYKFEPERGEFTKEDLKKAGDVGGTDAMILFSLIYPEDGSFSLNFWTYDGRQPEDHDKQRGIAELPDQELFKVWMMLASRLGRSTTLSEPKRQFAQDVHQTISDILTTARGKS
jgi:hypothetical protein